MSMSSLPINVDNNETNHGRRRSFLDIGGLNSINNFASSYKRAQNYMGSSFLETPFTETISPNSSPPFGASVDDSTLVPTIPQGYNHIKTFSFPEPDEVTSLLEDGPQSTRTSISLHHFGNSTAPQTFFNSVNTLMGIGMLSLPFGLKLAGWFWGSIMLALSSVLTCITAIILGKIIQKNPHLHTYGDIAYAFGGPTFSYFVTVIFSIDLIGASLSLILLFADSFTILFPSINSSIFKSIIVSFVFILSFFPLSILSLLSLAGIFCTLSIIIVIFICGFSTHIAPGSLFTPEYTNFYPLNLKSFLFSLGIFMAPWGGHPVFPELYRDMRHPSKYANCCKSSFSITFIFDYLIAVIGFLMFGVFCNDSIIKNLMGNSNYPSWVNPLICVFMGILPISKLPLVTKPIVTVYENIIGIPIKQDGVSVRKLLGRFVFFSLLLATSLLFNSFGQLISFLGSLICFNICLTLPFLFYLYFCEESNVYIKLLLKLGILIGISGAILGTYASITMDPLEF